MTHADSGKISTTAEAIRPALAAESDADKSNDESSRMVSFGEDMVMRSGLTRVTCGTDAEVAGAYPSVLSEVKQILHGNRGIGGSRHTTEW